MGQSSGLPRSAIFILSLAYTLFIAIIFGLRWLVFDKIWFLAMINTIFFALFLPLPVLLMGAIYRRQKWAFVVLLLPISVFIYFWGTLFLPTIPSPDPQADQKIRAMSYNVLFSNKTPKELLVGINAAAPDIIGLQEMTQKKRALLRTELSTIYPYDTFDSVDSSGVELMSRYPIISAAQVEFPPKNLALHAIIDWHDQPVHVFAAHFAPNHFFKSTISGLQPLANERYSQRAFQVTRLLAEMETLTEPIILLCDCNLTDTSEAYQRLDQKLDDSYRSVGWGLGHTLHPHNIPFPVQRIDYVWHSPDFTAIDAYVGSTGGSDHHPVISTLAFKGSLFRE